MTLSLNILPRLLETLLEFFYTRKTRDTVNRIIMVYDGMRELINEAFIHRVVIFKVENGGGIIRANGHLYASVLYEDFDKDYFVSGIKNEAQRMMLDKHFIEVLASILANGFFSLSTSETPLSSMAGNSFRAKNICFSEWHLIHQDKKGVTVCLINTCDKNDRFEQPIQRSCITNQINKIRNAMSGKKIRS